MASEGSSLCPDAPDALGRGGVAPLSSAERRNSTGNLDRQGGGAAMSPLGRRDTPCCGPEWVCPVGDDHFASHPPTRGILGPQFSRQPAGVWFLVAAKKQGL